MQTDDLTDSLYNLLAAVRDTVRQGGPGLERLTLALERFDLAEAIEDSEGLPADA